MSTAGAAPSPRRVSGAAVWYFLAILTLLQMFTFYRASDRGKINSPCLQPPSPEVLQGICPMMEKVLVVVTGILRGEGRRLSWKSEINYQCRLLGFQKCHPASARSLSRSCGAGFPRRHSAAVRQPHARCSSPKRTAVLHLWHPSLPVENENGLVPCCGELVCLCFLQPPLRFPEQVPKPFLFPASTQFPGKVLLHFSPFIDYCWLLSVPAFPWTTFLMEA